ncbi:MAG: flavin reductase family protein [Longimicrobiales bacterium]
MSDPVGRVIEGESLYALLRVLTSPIVAITTSAQGQWNGMIANSAQRASLVPSQPRVSVYISKTNFSHDLVYRSGVFGLHLLRSDQWEVVRVLGLRSGREGAKLSEGTPVPEGTLAARRGVTECPLLADSWAALECRVVNAMDTGASTFFLGDVVHAEADATTQPPMSSEHFRQHLPPELLQLYESRLVAAQAVLERLAGSIERAPWPGPVVMP